MAKRKKKTLWDRGDEFATAYGRDLCRAIRSAATDNTGTGRYVPDTVHEYLRYAFMKGYRTGQRVSRLSLGKPVDEVKP